MNLSLVLCILLMLLYVKIEYCKNRDRAIERLGNIDINFAVVTKIHLFSFDLLRSDGECFQLARLYSLYGVYGGEAELMKQQSDLCSSKKHDSTW